MLSLVMMALWLLLNPVEGQHLALDTFPPTCDGCFCVPDSTTDGGVCPSKKPETIFNFTAQLKSMRWKNPILLDCNAEAYTAANSESCRLTDARGRSAMESGDLWGPDAVCGIKYDMEDIKANNCIRSYETKTFASRQELEAEGSYSVTHLGGRNIVFLAIHILAAVFLRTHEYLSLSHCQKLN